MDRIEILNRALLRIGEVPLIGEDDPAAPQSLAIYDSVLENLGSFPFSFFKQTERLVRLSRAPEAHWKYAFQLPAPRIGPPRAVYRSSDLRVPTTAYDLVADTLVTDHEQVWITWLRLMVPHRWPGDFRELFITAVMAELALSVREDRPLHDRLHQKAFGTPGQQGLGGMLANALGNDNQAIPSDAPDEEMSPLLDARWG